VLVEAKVARRAPPPVKIPSLGTSNPVIITAGERVKNGGLSVGAGNAYGQFSALFQLLRPLERIS